MKSWMNAFAVIISGVSKLSNIIVSIVDISGEARSRLGCFEVIPLKFGNVKKCGLYRN